MAKESAKEKNKSAAPEAAAAPGAAGATTAAPAKGKPPIVRVAIILVVVLLLEAGTVVGTIMLTGGPKTVEAKPLVNEAEAAENAPVELLVVKDQFANSQTGKTMLFETEIWITVKKKFADKIKKQVESSQAALSTDLATIYRRAEPAQLREPTLATLTRQVKGALEDRLGKDSDGQPFVLEVLIKKSIGYRADP